MHEKHKNSPASLRPWRQVLLVFLVAGVSLFFIYENYVNKGGVAEANEAERPAASSLESVVVTGKILDPKGQPLAGAKVSCSLSGMDSDPPDRNAISDEKGEFRFEFKMPLLDQYGYPTGISIWATHPDFFGRPCECGKVQDDWSNVTLKLCPGTIVRGAVMDSVTQKPAAGVRIVAKDPANYDSHEESTDASGRFKIVLPKRKYWLSAITDDRIAKATMVDTAPDDVELDPILLVRGGTITGRIIRESTRKPLTDVYGISLMDSSIVDEIGSIGPADPQGNVAFADIDANGRYSIHVYPGENYPYTVYGPIDRENATKQPPVVVKDGETVEHDLLWDFCEPKLVEEFLVADAVTASLPEEPDRRARQLVLHLGQLEHIDFSFHWTAYLYELIRVGPEAVPAISRKLDELPWVCTASGASSCHKNDELVSVLAFALRGIDDPRGIPALIRSIPELPWADDDRTDPNILNPQTNQRWPAPQEPFAVGVLHSKPRAFLKQFELAECEHEEEFLCFQDSTTEVAAALASLSKRSVDSIPQVIGYLPRTERRKVFRRNRFNQLAQEWANWWEENWNQFTHDESYSTVDLSPRYKEPEVVPALSLKKGMTLVDMGAIDLSPPVTESKDSMTFLDLDAGLGYRWPAHLPRDEKLLRTPAVSKQLTDWAKGKGIDLMAISRKNPDGSMVLFLRPIDATVYELAQRDFETAAGFLNAGVLPKGQKITGDIACPNNADADAKSQKPHYLIMTQAGTWVILSCSISRDESNASSELLLDIQEILEPKPPETPTGTGP